jgi:hypothetical protein
LGATAAEEVDAPRAAGIGELRRADAHHSEHTLHNVILAGGDGDLRDVTLRLILRHHGEARGQRNIRACRRIGDDQLATPAPGDDHQRNILPHRNIVQRKTAIDPRNRSH